MMKNNYDGMLRHIDELLDEVDRMQECCEDVIKDYCTRVFKENFEEIVKNIKWKWFVPDYTGDEHLLYFSGLSEEVPSYIRTLFDYMEEVPYIKIQIKEGVYFEKSFDKFLAFTSIEDLMDFSKTVKIHIVE